MKILIEIDTEDRLSAFNSVLKAITEASEVLTTEDFGVLQATLETGLAASKKKTANEAYC